MLKVQIFSIRSHESAVALAKADEGRRMPFVPVYQTSIGCGCATRNVIRKTYYVSSFATDLRFTVGGEVAPRHASRSGQGLGSDCFLISI